MITEKWLLENPDYTCHCGLYVHPSKRNPNAFHIKDCQFYVDILKAELILGKKGNGEDER